MNESTGDPQQTPGATTESPARQLLRLLFAVAPAVPGVAHAGRDVVMLLESAAARARAAGCAVLLLGVQPATEIGEVAALHAAIAMQSVRHGRAAVPTVLLSAGGLLRDGAVAGPADLALALALALDAHRAIHAYAAGPDPRDGAAVEVFLAPDTMARAHAANMPPGEVLKAANARALFATLGDVRVLPAAGASPAVVRAVLITQD